MSFQNHTHFKYDSSPHYPTHRHIYTSTYLHIYNISFSVRTVAYINQQMAAHTSHCDRIHKNMDLSSRIWFGQTGGPSAYSGLNGKFPSTSNCAHNTAIIGCKSCCKQQQHHHHHLHHYRLHLHSGSR